MNKEKKSSEGRLRKQTEVSFLDFDMKEYEVIFFLWLIQSNVG